MKKLNILMIAVILALVSACATTVKFPVSSMVPAADISATKKKDKNNNNVVEVTAENLAEPGRLNPSRNNYSVWIVTGNNSTKNVGQLQNNNAKKAELKITTPFEVKEIFITAEDQGNLNAPLGTEISRVKFD